MYVRAKGSDVNRLTYLFQLKMYWDSIFFCDLCLQFDPLRFSVFLGDWIRERSAQEVQRWKSMGFSSADGLG